MILFTILIIIVILVILNIKYFQIYTNIRYINIL